MRIIVFLQIICSCSGMLILFRFILRDVYIACTTEIAPILQ